VYAARLPDELLPKARPKLLSRIALRSLLLLLLLPGWVAGIPSLYGQHTQFSALLFRLELNAAEDYAARVPALADRLYLQNHVAFYRALITQSPAAISTYTQASARQLAALEQKPAGSKRWLYPAEIELKQAVVLASAGRMLPAGQALKRAQQLLNKHVQQLGQADPQAQRIGGLIQLAMSAVPDSYQWLVKLMGMQGDLSTGLQMIRQSAAWLPPEHELVRYFAERTLLGQVHGPGQRIAQLYQQQPDMALLAYVYAHYLQETHQHKQALRTLEQLRPHEPALPYICYLRAKAYFYTDAYGQAIAAFQRFLQLSPGPLYRLDALAGIAQAQALLGQTAAMQLQCQAILKQSSTASFDQDAYALHWAARYAVHRMSHMEMGLLRLRQLYDAGRYDEGISAAQAFLPYAGRLAPDLQVELYYRLGRLYAASSPSQARHYYLLAVAPVADQARWMQAYAHYYLGQDAARLRHYDKARAEYRAALRYHHIPYRRGLELKTKTALRQLP
jgi:tetratricopeptide (TPR) repeat protein